MKNRITIIILSVIITSLVWMTAVQDAKNRLKRDIEQTVYNPTYTVILDIRETVKRGDLELLSKKMDKLEREWEGFISKTGNSPHIFIPKILELK